MKMRFIERLQLSTSTISLLVNLIGYEADTHKKFFPETEVLWLDNDRTVDEDILPKLAKNTYDRIRGIAVSLPHPISDKELLLALSKVSA